MRRRYRIGRPQNARAVFADQPQSGGNGAGEPCHPSIRQSRPGDVSSLERQMPRRIPRECPGHRNSCRNIAQLVVCRLRISSPMRAQDNRFPSICRKITRKTERPLQTAAPATRRIVKCDHQNSLCRVAIGIAVRGCVRDQSDSPLLLPVRRASGRLSSIQTSGGAGWLRKPSGLAERA